MPPGALGTLLGSFLGGFVGAQEGARSVSKGHLKKRPASDDRTRFFVSSRDRSVGIEGHEAQVLVWVHVDDLGFVKATLAEAFQKIWGEKRVNVLTEAECDEENA